MFPPMQFVKDLFLLICRVCVYVSVCLSVRGYVHTRSGAQGGQVCPIPLELELQASVSYLMWALGTELRAERVAHRQAIAPVCPPIYF